MNKKGMQTVRLARKSSGSKRSKRTRTDTSGKHSHMFSSFLSCFFDCDDFSDVNIFWFSGPVTSTPGQVKHSKRSLFSSPSGITSASLQHLSVSERYSEMFFSRPHFVPHVIWWFILSFHDSVFGQHLYVYSIGVDNIWTHCLFSLVYTRMLVNWALRLYLAQQNIYWWLILIHLFVTTRAATTRGSWT